MLFELQELEALLVLVFCAGCLLVQGGFEPQEGFGGLACCFLLVFIFSELCILFSSCLKFVHDALLASLLQTPKLNQLTRQLLYQLILPLEQPLQPLVFGFQHPPFIVVPQLN